MLGGVADGTSNAVGYPNSPPLPTVCGRLKNSFEEIKVLWIFGFKNLGATSHICASKLVSRTFLVAKFELALSEPEMQERIADCAGTVHGV